MGFLLKLRNRGGSHGGVPVPSPQTRIAPVAAASTVAKTGTIVLSVKVVTPSVAVSYLFGRDAGTILAPNSPQSVTPSAATTNATANTPLVQLASGVVNNTNGQFIMGTNGAIPIYWDRAAKWTSDATWRAGALHNSLNTYSDPTKAGSVGGGNKLDASTNLHGDGRFVDLVAKVSTPDASFGPQFNEPCFEFTFPGANQGSSTPTCMLAGVFPDAVNVYSVFLLRRRAYCSIPEFTAVGDGNSAAAITFNNGQGAGFKDGPYATFYSGRAGLQSDNGQVVGGHPISNYDLINFNEGGGTGGIQGLAFGVSTGADRRDGNLYLDAVHLEQWIRASDSTTWCSATYFRRPDNSSTWQQISPRMVGQTSGQYQRYFELYATSQNYNKSRSTPLKWWITDLAVFNPDLGGLHTDPVGVFAQIAATQPENPTNLVINSSSTSTINLRVTRGRYTGYLRLRIDGTFITGKDYTVLREEGEYQVTGGTSAALGTSTFSVTGLGLSAGSHTVQVYAVSKDGLVLSASGPSTSISV